MIAKIEKRLETNVKAILRKYIMENTSENTTIKVKLTSHRYGKNTQIFR